MSSSLRPIALAVSAFVSSSLMIGCGGGGGGSNAIDTPTPTPTPAPTVLSGVVAGNGLIKNAVVCLDLNANGACDAGEPASAKTGADGAYSISVDTSQVTADQIAKASLIAPQVPGTVTDGNATIDMADPSSTSTTAAYVLRQVPGKAGQINPLTTLVTTAVAGGMTEKVARDNLVIQLGLKSSALIDDYQSDVPTNAQSIEDTARTAAALTASLLEQGAAPSVADQSAAASAAQGSLRSLSYSDASNYRYVDYLQLAKDPGSSDQKFVLHRAGKASGADIAASSLYTQAYLSDKGWLYCDASVSIVSHGGSPNKALSCDASSSLGGNLVVDISGKTMASVVSAQQQASSGNVINAGVDAMALLAALGDAKFPEGSQLQQRVTLNVNRPLYINNVSTDYFVQSTGTTLEQIMAARPTSKVNLATGGGMVNLGLGAGNNQNLRVSFTAASSPSAGSVQFYSCDFNATQTASSNCVAVEAGTYSIETLNGSRVLRFAGHAETPMSHVRLLAEVGAAQQRNQVFGSGDWVAVARQDKPGLAVNGGQQNRLNATAWTAMKTRLGL